MIGSDKRRRDPGPYLTDPLLRELIPTRPPAKPAAPGPGPTAAMAEHLELEQLEAAEQAHARTVRHLRAVGE